MQSESQNAPELHRQALLEALATLEEATPESHEAIFLKFGVSNDDRARFVQHTMGAPRNNTSGFGQGMSKVPKIIHRLWLTNPTEPSCAPESYLLRIARQASRLDRRYQLIFWHNSSSTDVDPRRHLADSGAEFLDINETLSDEKGLDRVRRAISARKFVLAGDISKFLILREYGGIYADLGVDFHWPLLDLVHRSDISLFLDRNLFYQPAFMAAAPNCAPFRLWCNLLREPEVFSSIALSENHKLSCGNEIWMHGGVGFSAALMLFYDSSYSILSIPPNKGLLHHESEGSWYRVGNKFGNATLEEAAITHLDWEKHASFVVLESISNLLSNVRGGVAG
jgi:hypothetical protein